MSSTESESDELFLRNYNANDRRIASEFLSDWLPFLTNGLCDSCSIKLTHKVRSLRPADENDKNSVASWKDGVNDAAETNSLGSWKDGESGCVEPSVASGESGCVEPSVASGANGYSTSDSIGMSAPAASGGARMSWADMAQEDELEGDDESEVTSSLSVGNFISGDGNSAVKVASKQVLSRDQREYIRFTNVKRKKDFACFERINTKLVNIVDGLELHTGVFSAVEQKRIVDYVYELEELGKKGKLKARTYTAPQKWMRGKGRVTIQFGCCYNYASDKKGNPPGILQDELVDKIPHLFKVIIRRSVLVLNGNGADVAKHCVPAVPTKRISITFRKMDESKWPVGFTPEPDLQGIQPLAYEVDRSKRSNISKINRPAIVQATRSENNRDRSKERGLFGTGPRTEGPWNRRRLRLSLED